MAQSDSDYRACSTQLEPNSVTVTKFQGLRLWAKEDRIAPETFIMIVYVWINEAAEQQKRPSRSRLRRLAAPR